MAMAEDQEEVLFSTTAEAKCGFFSLFSERYFVLTESQLRWFDKLKDFENNFPPEKCLALADVISITVLEGNEKWPGQFEVLSVPDVKWEFRCKTSAEVDEWIEKLPTPALPEESPVSPAAMPQEITVPIEDFQKMQQQVRDMTSELSLLRVANGGAECEEGVLAPPIVRELEALRAELEETKASLLRSEQSNASLAARLCEVDATMAELEERATAAEAQAVRLTELLSSEKGESAHSETELMKQVKRMEADKRVLKDAMEAQIQTLQAKIEAHEKQIAEYGDQSAAAVQSAMQAQEAKVVELQAALDEARLASEQAKEEKSAQRSNYRMELDATRAQLQVRDAELQASRDEEDRVNSLLFGVEQEVSALKRELERTSDAQSRAEALQAALKEEKEAHAATKEDLAMDFVAKGKVAAKKVTVAQGELTKSLATLESTVNQLNQSQGQCAKLSEEIQLLKVHTEQIMHAWNQEREAIKARGRHKLNEDADDRFTKLSEIQGTISDQAEGLVDTTSSEINQQLNSDVHAFSDAVEYTTEKRALSAEAEVARLQKQLAELSEQMELPGAVQEDVRTLRMVGLLREEAAQAKKEKAEAISGMLLTEQDNDRLKEENAASSAHIAQLMDQLHKMQAASKKSRNPFKK